MGIHIRIIVHNYKIFILQRIASHPFFFLANFFSLTKVLKQMLNHVSSYDVTYDYDFFTL